MTAFYSVLQMSTATDEDTEQVTISGVPVSLLEKLQEIADAEKRSRSAQTILLLEEIVARKLKGAR